jgi:hypothetical protein
MAQLPIALAIEPRLLPYAEANGFRMDPKVHHTPCHRSISYSEQTSIETLFSVRCSRSKRSIA